MYSSEFIKLNYKMKTLSFLSNIAKKKINFMYLATFSATLSIVTTGMHFGWPSPSLPLLRRMNNSTLFINENEGSWLAVTPSIGALVGGVLTAVFTNNIGRKKLVILAFIPLFTAWIIIVFCNSLLQLFIARFIAGIGDGCCFTVVPLYISEIAHSSNRGLLGSGVTSALLLGYLLINVFGSFFSIKSTALISSVIPIVGFLIFFWMPESPYYLLMCNQVDKAKQQLQVLRGLENVQIEVDRISEGIRKQMKNSRKFLDLFSTKTNRKSVVIILVLRGFQQMSGLVAITFYTQDIFEESGNHSFSPKITTIIFYSVQLAVTFISTIVVDKFGRRPLIFLSLSGSAVALFCEGSYLYIKTQTSVDISSSWSYISIVFLLGFIIFFSFGMQSIPTLMVVELFPSNVKPFALCSSDAYFYLVTSVVSKLFQYVKDHFGLFVPFYVFAANCFVGLIITIFIVPETKGKSLEEIQQHLEEQTAH